MQEHPVPQNVTSYEFHLIGNMTLKQFLELAGGIVIGVLIYQTNLPQVIKWPFIVFFVGLGALVAFVPFEGRPLDQWLIALIRAIYKPTEFYWRKSAHIPDFFLYTRVTNKTYAEELDLTPVKHKRIMEYIDTLPQQKQRSQLDQLELEKVQQVTLLFDQVQVQEVTIEKQIEKPDVKTQPRSLQPKEKLFGASQNQTQQIYSSANKIVDVPIPEQTQPQVAQTQQPSADQTAAQPVADQNAYSSAQAQHGAPQQAQEAMTSASLPFPKKPTSPNVVVGMVFNTAGKIVANAIVEITNQEGMPVRAVKTNSIGQFFISTPLKDGQYYLNVEKDGSTFPTIELQLQQTYLDPLDIRAST